VADIKSEPRPASNRNRWPASYWNAWPASSESASLRKTWQSGVIDPAEFTVEIGCPHVQVRERRDRAWHIWPREAGATALKGNADRHAANVLPIIAEIQKSDAKTLRAIADARGFGPFWGKGFCRTSRRTGWDSWACATAWTGTALNFPV
jgi:hypothetical protein